MRNLVCIIALVSCLFAGSVAASAQSWSMQLYYGSQAKQTAIVASTKLTEVTNVLGKGYTLDVDAFGGAFSNGTPVGGFSVGKRFPLADRVSGYLGLAFSVVQGRPNDFGPMVGISARF